MREEFVFAIENVVKDVSLSQSGCEVHEDGLGDDRQRSLSQCLSHVVRRIDSSGIRRMSSNRRCGRKNTPRFRKASILAEDRKQLETVRLPRGGR